MLRIFFLSVACALSSDAPFRDSRLLTLGTTAAGFGLIAVDVFAAKHVMPVLDSAAIDAAGSDACFDSQKGRALSNLAGVLVGATATACVAPQQDRRSALVVAGAWAGVLNPSVLALKDAFHRQRPDPAHHIEYSFPSGHTANAAFLSASLFSILLPQLRVPLGGTSAALLTTLCTVAVACGRILTEAHYLSDTLAGACIGLFFANLAALVARPTKETPADFEF